MFNLSGSELVVIVLLALVVLGPEKLPEAMRKAGQAYRELKRMSTTFQNEMRSAIDEPLREMKATADLITTSAKFGEEPPASPAATGSPPTPAAEPEAPGPPTVAPDPVGTTSASTGAPPSEPDPEPGVDPA